MQFTEKTVILNMGFVGIRHAEHLPRERKRTMQYKVFGDTLVIRLQRGEELLSGLKKACEAEQVTAAEVTGIGAADHAVVGVYSFETQQYISNEFNEELEITNLLGSVTLPPEGSSDTVYPHIHACFASKYGQAIGGHLNECRISGTCELFVRKLPFVIDRMKDCETGLNILRLE